MITNSRDWRYFSIHFIQRHHNPQGMAVWLRVTEKLSYTMRSAPRRIIPQNLRHLVILVQNPVHEQLLRRWNLHDAREVFEGSRKGSRGMCTVAANSDVNTSSMLHESVELGSFTTVLEGVQIGKGTRIGNGCVIGPDVTIGADCVISSNCTVSNSTLGDRVVLLPGVRIGQDGFGFTPTGKKDQPIVKKPQLLRVVLGDDVEIGANSTVDRGSWRDTSIGAFTKVDNLVQIGHNVVLGRACLIAAQSGIAGSTTIGDGVMIGGQVGVAQHLTIGSGVMIAAKSGVMHNLQGGVSYGGCPAVPVRQWHRQTLHLRKLAEEVGGSVLQRKDRNAVH